MHDNFKEAAVVPCWHVMARFWTELVGLVLC